MHIIVQKHCLWLASLPLRVWTTAGAGSGREHTFHLLSGSSAVSPNRFFLLKSSFFSYPTFCKATTSTKQYDCLRKLENEQLIHLKPVFCCWLLTLCHKALPFKSKMSNQCRFPGSIELTIIYQVNTNIVLCQMHSKLYSIMLGVYCMQIHLSCKNSF